MKTKKEILAILSKFTWLAFYDQELQKHYLVFNDRKRGGTYTLMLHKGQWSIHGYGINYCDDGETFLTEKETVDFIWNHRAAFRQTVILLNTAKEEMQRDQVQND